MVQYEQIEVVNSEDMINGLCRAGEECFQKGAFKEALRLLLRCIKAPKSEKIKPTQAKSYRILGTIYCYLGQSVLAREHLLKAVVLSKENDYERELIDCYINFIFLYECLGNYERALTYQEEVLNLIQMYKEKDAEEVKNMEVFCLTCQGIIYSKEDKMQQAEEVLIQVEELAKEINLKSVTLPIISLALRVAYEKQEKEQFLQYFDCLLQIPILEEGFFETLEYYFDLCDYFLQKGLQKEMRRLLDYIKSYYDMIPLSYLKYHICEIELHYAQQYEDDQMQWEITQKLFEVIQEYEDEQQNAKSYSFDYIEYLHAERDLSAKMEQKSKLDAMTGLFNKFTIESLVDEYFSQMNESNVAALILIDMDNFKRINDTLGHLAGDAILTDTATIIRRFFKRDALCGRVGGDEFMVFVKDVQDVSSLLLQAEFLRQEIAQTTVERNIGIAVQASVGIAVSTLGVRDYANMFEAADEALYRAKKEGRNRIFVMK